MVRTQIQLSEKQSEAVKRLASEHDMSVAEVIRRAVDEMLVRRPPIRDEAEIRRRALSAIGFIKGGPSDLSTNHDRYLAEAYSHMKK